MSQMEMELFKYVLGAIVAGFFIYVITPIINAIKTKYQNTMVLDFAITAIRAAEQEFSKEQSIEKKNAVMNQVANYIAMHTSLNLTSEEINTLIEGSIKIAKKIYKGAE